MSSPASSLGNQYTELENLIAETAANRLKEKESSITVPAVHMSLLAWLQVLSIVFTGCYFAYAHISQNETSNTLIKSRQAAIGKRLDNVEVNVSTINDSVNKMSGKLDILIMLASKK